MYGLPDSAIIGTAKRLRSLAARNGRFGGTNPARGFSMSFKFKGITFRRAELDFMLNNPSGAVGEYLEKRGKLMVLAAKQQVGVSTGQLRASIKMMHDRSSRGQFIKIGSPLPYALVHHEGSRPHPIVARNAQFLRFSSKGRVVYTKQVMHPGTKPNKYLSGQLWMVKI